ncbi:fad fmn-dependent dehydrogenase : D-lactate dehydrogenase (Cytochrome) OS=Pirellula staleyi (strain ATCC 27377 / DSM 6068 / ICPB 4128) GN=Psta_2342 PE=4 SV=1: FAD_binding_4: FAD-oxidase_C: Fer4_8: CCG [Gemmataceae bacterium]|nr:fad fmn-dependent dehydrogenase : D-lactate dehydrogenase (Cytochrome) OS=Pirellula staleyi (strain ATCC 27377 / DSM 6068 / ICPB 4128) GN=Psta_2342 PE=4 SV=1: FAD_binding_4: FAD-oxidase_C: Fer4_8: CCG [Gemmataceae bacterium]VTU00692.1 fad fmn-dependent dehydrogenase : D-lactate dehydrogenase (Cytochrome) OS=Pirellula staleyi (strain ATCC 27377 / DSM 6068 / ICPB 4128) GN=Psta_2342 PE=4 SV=1: FAD_binding_4: FAD-oxidase_C: Fer4_8: CCG [Gemmataceae bacterium]
MDPKQITDDLRGAYRGALAFDALTRGLYATDASPFQVAPLAVAVPEDAADVAALVRYCAEHNIPVVPRGGGTGVAGESLGPAVVLDLSVKFKRIGAVTGDRVTAEPGVTCEALNRELARHGRRFAPDPASAATCTVGGMVATNASGGNAFRHGYTRDHVCGLDVVLDDGSPAVLGDDPKAQASERLEQIRTATAELLAANRAAIEQHRPRTAFNRCGYVLHDVLAADGPDLVKLLVGSEGTLAVTTAATLRTVPLPGGTCVALVGFPTLDAAVRAGTDLRHFEPVACDLLDRRLLSVTRRGGPDGFGPVPPAVGAALVVTFEADTEREASERASGAIETLRHRHLLRVLAGPTRDPEGVARVRAFRGTAVSGLYGLAGGARPLAFVEDVGVPVESLPAYLAGVQDALKRHELTASFLIHALTGQVHTRPLVDLNDPADRAKLWPAAEDIHALALALGGTVSTQHGTGLARTPWVERQYGPVYAVFRELKRVFDPKNVLNPGKIVGPDPSREAWPLRVVVGDGTLEVGKNGTAAGGAPGSGPTSNPPSPIPLLVWKDSSPAQEVAKCSGCGDCRTANPARRMCPVFRATGDEAASPRAKPNLLRVLADPAVATPEEVRAVAALCVNCKMCRDECDARVNVPKLMIETKAALHAEHGLGWNEWAQARMEGLSVLGSNFAPVVNTLLGRLGARWVLEKLLGVSRHRRLPAFTLRNFFRRARGAGLSKKRVPGRPPPPEFRTGRVAYFVDVYAAYTDPMIAEATVAVLHHNGVEVYVPPRQVGCGMGALAVGDLETAREHAVRNVRALADLVREGYRVVCSEPTAALMLSQDYPDLLDDPDTAAVAAATVELTAYLAELHAAGRLRTDFRALDLTLGHHVPCHVKALRGAPAGPGLLSLIPGLRVRTIDVGCSGMAGQWGLMAANREASLAAGAPVLAELNRPGLIFGSTECSSCRIQLQDGTGKRTLHPVEYLALAYGLMPEVEARLRKPLTELVTE